MIIWILWIDKITPTSSCPLIFFLNKFVLPRLDIFVVFKSAKDISILTEGDLDDVIESVKRFLTSSIDTPSFLTQGSSTTTVTISSVWLGRLDLAFASPEADIFKSSRSREEICLWVIHNLQRQWWIRTEILVKYKFV